MLRVALIDASARRRSVIGERVEREPLLKAWPARARAPIAAMASQSETRFTRGTSCELTRLGATTRDLRRSGAVTHRPAVRPQACFRHTVARISTSRRARRARW